jgi:hypothetical protein
MKETAVINLIVTDISEPLATDSTHQLRGVCPGPPARDKCIVTSLLVCGHRLTD